MGIREFVRRLSRGPSSVPGPTGPPARAPEWRSLPPLQRLLAGPSLVTDPDRFREELVTWGNPSVVATPAHLLSPDAPSGSVTGLVEFVGRPASRTGAASDGADGDAAPRGETGTAAAPSVQRVVQEADAPLSRPDGAAAPLLQVTEEIARPLPVDSATSAPAPRLHVAEVSPNPAADNLLSARSAPVPPPVHRPAVQLSSTDLGTTAAEATPWVDERPLGTEAGAPPEHADAAGPSGPADGRGASGPGPGGEPVAGAWETSTPVVAMRTADVFGPADSGPAVELPRASSMPFLAAPQPGLASPRAPGTVQRTPTASRPASTAGRRPLGLGAPLPSVSTHDVAAPSPGAAASVARRHEPEQITPTLGTVPTLATPDVVAVPAPPMADLLRADRGPGDVTAQRLPEALGTPTPTASVAVDHPAVTPSASPIARTAPTGQASQELAWHTPAELHDDVDAVSVPLIGGPAPTVLDEVDLPSVPTGPDRGGVLAGVSVQRAVPGPAGPPTDSVRPAAPALTRLPADGVPGLPERGRTVRPVGLRRLQRVVEAPSAPAARAVRDSAERFREGPAAGSAETRSGTPASLQRFFPGAPAAPGLSIPAAPGLPRPQFAAPQLGPPELPAAPLAAPEVPAPDLAAPEPSAPDPSGWSLPAAAPGPPFVTPALEQPASEESPAASSSATGGGPAPSAPGGAAPGGVPPGDVDALVRRLYDPLARKLKAELRLDRERVGRALDLRH